MSYTITRSDGNILTIIPDNVIDTTSTPFSLPGRDFAGYGEPIDTNFVRQLENFANVTVPTNPIRGQLWYDISDPTNPIMRICPQDGETNPSNWQQILGTNPSGDLVINPGNVIVPVGNVDANNVNASNLIQGRLGYIYSTDEAFSTVTGAFQVVGGVGIGKNVHVGGNAYVSGNLSVNGDITYINVTTLAVEDPIISQGNGPNNTPLTSNDGKDRGSLLNYYTTTPMQAFMGWDNSANEFIFGSDVTVVGEVVTVNTLGNIRVGNVIGTVAAPGGAGSNRQVIFNDNGAYGTDAGFTFDKVTGNVTVGGSVISSAPVGTPPLAVTSTTRVNGLYVEGSNLSNIQLATAGTYYITFASSTTGNRLLNANTNLSYDAATGLLTSVGGFSGPYTTTSITTGAAATAGSITGTWSLTPGSSLQATYADLGERYHTDIPYPIGTLMKVGGLNEVTMVRNAYDDNVCGVISDTAAYIMNADAGNNDTHPVIGLVGRIKVRVIGEITKGDKLVSAGNGCAMKFNQYSSIGMSIGWALESSNDPNEKLILCMIK